MNNLDLILRFLTKHIPNSSVAYQLQDDNDGLGPYIADWFEPRLGPEPTPAEVSEAEPEALAWAQLGASEISYYDFWELLTLPLQVLISNEAERLRALPVPDTELKVLIGKTYDPSSMIVLSDPVVTGAGGYFESILNKLVVNGVLTPAQAGAWGSLQEVS
jgi:hypothetical protein